MPATTVRRLIDNNVRLHALCKACRHHDALDLDALGLRPGFGPWSLPLAAQRFKQLARLASSLVVRTSYHGSSVSWEMI